MRRDDWTAERQTGLLIKQNPPDWEIHFDLVATRRDLLRIMFDKGERKSEKKKAEAKENFHLIASLTNSFHLFLAEKADWRESETSDCDEKVNEFIFRFCVVK